MKDRDRANLDDPMVKKLIELVGLWWPEAGRYQVLPLDDRLQVRALGREALYGQREHMTFDEGAVRIQPFEAPQDPQPLLGGERRDRGPRRRRRRPHRRAGRDILGLVAVPQGLGADALLQLLRDRVHLHPRQRPTATRPAPGPL